MVEVMSELEIEEHNWGDKYERQEEVMQATTLVSSRMEASNHNLYICLWREFVLGCRYGRRNTKIWIHVSVILILGLHYSLGFPSLFEFLVQVFLN